jgi:hypothetical protein
MVNLSADPFIRVSDAQAVYEMYRKSKPTEKKVFVLWEPFITKMLENPNTYVVTDSSKFRGYIVDALVVNRDFLAKNKEVVKDIVQAYLRSLYYYINEGDMLKLVIDDAAKLNSPLSEKSAQQILKGIWWKNTSENYVHMGVDIGNIQNVADMINNITKVLVGTGAIPKDPTDGKPNLLYYDGILSKLKEEGFHPGVENIRDEKIVLPALTEEQWTKLSPVGMLNVQPLQFARGSDSIISSEILDDLVEVLQTCPAYYVSVKGNATTGGDAEANIALAKSRAEAVVKYIVEHGIEPNRVRAISDKPTGESKVTFVLGQMPY